MLEVYGIPNCDTVKKALDWLKKKKVPFNFHDFKTEEVSIKRIEHWINKAGLEIVLNKKSTTWRNLAVEEQEKMSNKRSAIQAMQKQLTLIKRPVIEYGDDVSIGFKEEVFLKFLIK